MTQPKFAPILVNDEVRELYKLRVPPAWSPHRPADFRARPGARHSPGLGAAGPDQGYAMLLAERIAERLVLAEGEHGEDVLRGATVIAMRRAAMYGRAPVMGDLELALGLFGYLDTASAEVVEARREVFLGVGHDYWRQRELADLVPEATLRLSPAAVAERLAADPAAFHELSGLAE
ncbi:MAG TPA: hypothetical protein VFN50_02720 [Acidimicrobiales bacterium]|nr:hypothetical protein [Acidimicrobiales bacterium]